MDNSRIHYRSVKKTKKRKKIPLIRIVLAILLIWGLIRWVPDISINHFMKIKKIQFQSPLILKDSCLQSLFAEIDYNTLNEEKIDSLKNSIEKTGLFVDFEFKRKVLGKLKFEYEEASIVAMVDEDSVSCLINELGTLINKDNIKKQVYFPEFIGGEFVNKRLCNRRAFEIASQNMEYLKKNYNGIYSDIIRVYLNKDNTVDLILRNQKIMKVSSSTTEEDLDRLSYIFKNLYLDHKIDIIDLRFKEQIITKKI